MTEGTCSLKAGVRVGSVDEDSVGRVGVVELGWENFPRLSLVGNTLGTFRGRRFFGSAGGCLASLLRFGCCCWYRAIASGLPRNDGNGNFGLFVDVEEGWTSALVSNSLVELCIISNSSFIACSSGAKRDESIGDESECG